MTTIKIKKQFASLKECNEWEDAHLKELVPPGMALLMVKHSEEINKDAVVLDEIWCV